jgi:competence protein ComEA
VVPTVVQSGVATADPVVVIVHVAGAVVAPGVYRLESGARAIDAVERAGGVVLDADLDSVNLAAPLADGQRLYIPRVGEVPVVVALPEAGGSAGTPTGIVGPVNINRATSDELETLPGVGPTTAAAIITHRTQRGPVVTVDDLGDVSGIGTAKLAALRGLVTV